MIKHSKSSESNTPRLNDYIQLTFQVGTYSIDDFNPKIKAAVLQQKQSWDAPQIKDVKFIKQENYPFTTCKKSFIELGVLDK